jgi:hypothetical protein
MREHRIRWRGCALALCVWAFASTATAQDLCATAVARATKSYEAGNFADVIAIVEPCVAGLSRDDMWQAYRLLALAHLFRDEDQEANLAIDRMLQLNPRYERNPERDPFEFVQALERYDSYPQFSVAAIVGGNIASPNVVRSYTLDPKSGATAAYRGGIGPGFGAGAEYRLTRSLAVGLEALYQTSAFTRDGESAYKVSTSYQERQTYVTVPVYAKYYVPLGRVAPYILIGACGRFAPSATASVTSTDAINGTTMTTSGISSTARRTSATIGMVIGVGASYPVGSGYVSATMRYLAALTDNVVGGERYTNNDLLYQHYYLDDDMTMRNIELSVGYVLPISFRAFRIGGGQ